MVTQVKTTANDSLKEGRLDFVDLKSFARAGVIPFGNRHFFCKHFSPYVFIRDICVNKTILEIGFGEGYGLRYLSQFTGNYAGVDKSLKRYARGKYDLNNLFIMDGAEMGFKDNSFDVVYCFQVIEHIPETAVLKFLREIKRVLKNDCVFVCSTLNLEHHIKGDPAKYEKFHEHEKEYTCHELESLFKQVFEDVDMYGLFRTVKHDFFLWMKKWGLLKYSLFGRNPVIKFYDNISTSDFRVLRNSLRKAMDFIAVCRVRK